MSHRVVFQGERFIKLPSGVTVGDEFRVAGRVRVVSIAADEVEVTDFSRHQLAYQNGQITSVVRLIEMEIEQ